MEEQTVFITMLRFSLTFSVFIFCCATHAFICSILIVLVLFWPCSIQASTFHIQENINLIVLKWRYKGAFQGIFKNLQSSKSRLKIFFRNMLTRTCYNYTFKNIFLKIHLEPLHFQDTFFQ